MQVDDQEIKDRFDLTVCSHFMWQVNDLEKHLRKMENSSNYCAMIQPVGRDETVKEMWTKITGKQYSE